MQLYARNILIYLLLSSRWIYSTHLGLYDFGIEQEQKNKSFVEHNIVIIIFVTSMIMHFDFDLSMIISTKYHRRRIKVIQEFLL